VSTASRCPNNIICILLYDPKGIISTFQ